MLPRIGGVLLLALAAVSSAATLPVNDGSSEHHPELLTFPTHQSPHNSDEYPQRLKSLADQPTTTSTGYSVLRWLRDSTMEIVFGHKKAPEYKVPIQPRHYKDVVLRFPVTSPEEEEALAATVQQLVLDVWAFGEDWVDIRVGQDRVKYVLSFLPEEMRQSFRPLITDIPRAIKESMDCPTCATEGADSYDLFFDNYQPLHVVERWMRLIQSMFPSFVSTVNIGKSYEGRDITGLRISTSPRDPNQPPSAEPRKTMILAGGMHAREWISTAVVNFLAWSFISSFTSNDKLITSFLDHYDIIFLPALNPDGIEHTWTVDRLWRKNRQPTFRQFCTGFDLDHAFSYGWDAPGRLTHPCAESFGGREPFEAVEARVLADWATNETVSNNARIVSVIDFHSYSQQLLYPYSFSCATDPPNLENLEELAYGLAKAIKTTNGQVYTVSSACEGATTRGRDQAEPLRRAEYGGGSLIDWFSHDLHAHWSFQIKLRDTGNYGFLLPREYIKPTGREVFNAMRYICDYLLGNNGIEKSIRHKHGASAHHTPDNEVPEVEEQERPLDNDSEINFVHDELRKKRELR